MFLGPQGLVFLDSRPAGYSTCSGIMCVHLCACAYMQAGMCVCVCVCVSMSVWIVTVRATSDTEINSGSEGVESGAGCGQDAEEGRGPLVHPCLFHRFCGQVCYSLAREVTSRGCKGRGHTTHTQKTRRGFDI